MNQTKNNINQRHWLSCVLVTGVFGAALKKTPTMNDLQAVCERLIHDPFCVSHVMNTDGLTDQEEVMLAHDQQPVSTDTFFGQHEISLTWTRVRRGMFVTNSIWNDIITLAAGEALARRHCSKQTKSLITKVII